MKLLLAAIATACLFIVACGKPRRPVTEPELIGKWSVVELITHRGNRGPAAGILELRTEFFPNHTSTGLFKWGEAHSTNAEDSVPIAMSGTWALTSIITLQMETNSPKPSSIWFEKDLLVIEGRSSGPKSAGLTTIFRRSE